MKHLLWQIQFHNGPYLWSDRHTLKRGKVVRTIWALNFEKESEYNSSISWYLTATNSDYKELNKAS